MTTPRLLTPLVIHQLLINLPFSTYQALFIIGYFNISVIVHTEQDRFQGETSQSANITASVVQGLVLGPTLFNLNSCDLVPVSDLNRYFKYADDAYLIVTYSNASTIPAEIAHHSSGPQIAI